MPSSHAKILLSTSLLTIPSFLVCAHLRLYECMATNLSVLFWSVNYWRRPVYGWRRNVDILNVALCTLYHTYTSRLIETRLMVSYLFFITLAVGSYAVARRLPGIDGTIAHTGVHVFGNIANSFLYKGLYRLRGLDTHLTDLMAWIILFLYINIRNVHL